MDPHLEEMPDHAGPFYQAIRDVLIQNIMPAEQAIQALDNAWNLNHDAHILAWDQRVADDAAAAQQQPPQQPPLEDIIPQAQPVPDHDTDNAERRKPKMKDFDETATIGDYVSPRPAQYALRWVEDFEYVELWYFTMEGCLDAMQHQLTQHDEAFGLTKVDNMVTLKSFSSLKASRNVVPKVERYSVSMEKTVYLSNT